MADETNGSNGNGIWSRKMQWFGIFIKDIGLPGTFALVLLYVLVMQGPVVATSNLELKGAVVGLQALVGQQTLAVTELTRQMIDHRLSEERPEHFLVPETPLTPQPPILHR